MTRTTIATVLAGLAIATPGEARPTLAAPQSFGVPGGAVLVHYATSGVDAVPADDANTDGVPDFVAEVATIAEDALARFTARGFRMPLADSAIADNGGDGRIDVYLRDLNAADGNAGVDACVDHHCIGFVTSENDFAGFAYPSRTEAIRSVVPHELFHLVQGAYDDDQPATWTEGSAVWAVEHLYAEGNADFERFLPSFVTRAFRPFERPVAGFGDGYPYGAALWPYFLEHRFDVATIAAIWTACDDTGFLDATALATATPLDATWAEFTRWNWFTGPRAAGGLYPDASAWPEVPREVAIAEPGATVYVEGLSARYLPITLAPGRWQIALAPSGGIRIAAWIVAANGALDSGHELVDLATTLEGGDYTLVVTGLSRATITTPVAIAITPASEVPVDDASGCTAGGGGSGWLALALSGLLRRRRRTSVPTTNRLTDN